MENENYQPEPWVEIRTLEDLLLQAEARKSSHDTLTEKYRLIHVDAFRSFVQRSIEIGNGPNLENPHLIEFRRREAINAAIKKARELQASAPENKSETDSQIARIEELTRWDDEERAARQALKNGLNELYKKPEIRKSVHCLALLKILTNRLNGIEPFADLLAPVIENDVSQKNSKNGVNSGKARREALNRQLAKNMWNERVCGEKKYADTAGFIRAVVKAITKKKLKIPTERTVGEWITAWRHEASEEIAMAIWVTERSETNFSEQAFMSAVMTACAQANQANNLKFAIIKNSHVTDWLAKWTAKKAA
ncbi:MAG: hypothetical protein RR779_11540 [Comamonas sp.]